MTRDPELLRRIPAFGGLTTEALRYLVGMMTEVEVPAGEWFFRQGEVGDAVYVLESGTVEILRATGGHEVHLRTLGPGDCFGEMALLAIIPRSASIRVLDDAKALRLTNADLARLYHHDLPQFTTLVMNLGREVCRRLADTDERLFELTAEAKDDDRSD